MAVFFDDSTGDDLSTAGNVAGNTEQCALLWWFNLPSSGNSNNGGGVIGFGGFQDFPSGSREGLVFKQNSSSDVDFSFSEDVNVSNISSGVRYTTGANQDTWFAAGFVSQNNSTGPEAGSQLVYWSGSSTTTTYGTLSDYRGTQPRPIFIGSRPAAGTANFSVRMARCCYYEWTATGTVFTDTHWSMFANGAPPWMILPQYLKAWWELDDPSNKGKDRIGKNQLDGTVGGSPANFAHPWDKLKSAYPPVRIITGIDAAPGGAHPVGPLGHPLHGPFAGPVG